MQSRRRRLGVVLIGLVVNALSALGTASSWVAYSSGDASGLQYMFLYIGVWLAGPAGACMLVLCIRRILPWISLLAPALAIVLAMTPQISWIGYDSSLIDRPGEISAVMLLVLHAVLAAYGARWIWRSRAARHPQAQLG